MEDMREGPEVATETTWKPQKLNPGEMGRTGKVWRMKRRFVGFPKHEDFELVDEELPDLKDGEFVTETLVWSVDPYNRGFASLMPEGSPMIGYQVGKVVESKSSKYPVGTVLHCHGGWRTHVHFKAEAAEGEKRDVLTSEMLSHHPITYFVGVLGMPGATAFFGVEDTLRPKPGEVLVVNAASGAVGALVGQIGKIKGLTVIGYAGAPDKVEFLKEIGYDHAFNYKTEGLDETLDRAAPKGVDLFFDNVGYDFGMTVMNHMVFNGRICQCGAIAGYNDTEARLVKMPYVHFLRNKITWSGFIVSAYWDKFEEFQGQMSKWIREGKIKVKETQYNGFDKMPQALMDVLSGAARGKAVIVP